MQLIRKTHGSYVKGAGMNDQTIKADAGKRQLTLVPTQIIEDIAEVREYGNRKYGDSESWRRVEIQRYRDALFRHFIRYIRDPDGVDEESGLKHYKHMACNMAFLCELEKENQDECVKMGVQARNLRFKALCGRLRLMLHGRRKQCGGRKL